MKIQTKHLLMIAAIFFLAALVRFYNFPSRVTFWSEQARSLVVSADYLKTPSLLGQPYFIREDSNSHILFAGSPFNYLMVPLILMSGYDPIPITVFFALLSLFTGLIIYLLVKRMFGEGVAIISCLLSLFNDWMIYLSFFIWSYSFLPLVGILVLYFAWLFLKKRQRSAIFILGLLCGLGVSLQFLFLPIALAVFIFSAWLSKKKLSDITFFILGGVLGDLPMVIFDLRHNFYESRTLIQYFLDTLAGRSNASPANYYFLPFWPVLALGGGFLVFWLWKKSKPISVLVVIMYLFLNLTSSSINWKAPTGMPHGMTVRDLDRASKVIAADAKGDFNVAEVLDFDKRAYVLRYLVGYRYGKRPLSEISYQNLKLLYVLAPKDYDFAKSNIWEITSGGPYKIGLLTDVSGGYSIYRLTK